MHSRQFEKEYSYKCPRPGCKTTFQYPFDLNNHQRIHENNLDTCRYCPYRYVVTANYARHLKQHFQIRDFVCDQCDLKYATRGELNVHYQKHEGIIYNCLICKTYEANSRRMIESHLRSKHADIVGKNFNWGVVEHHVKVKQNIL